MSASKDGGAAFPTLGNVGYNSDWQNEEGMTLRDYFAGQALIGMMRAQVPYSHSWDECAERAYLQADAMLRARGTGNLVHEAAPDLFDAAKAALFVLNIVYDREPGTNEAGAIAILKDAIAKAEGRG